jgi:hypothetical protein
VAALSLAEVRAALHAAITERAQGAPTVGGGTRCADEGEDAGSSGATG